jgi:hypothetical protein
MTSFQRRPVLWILIGVGLVILVAALTLASEKATAIVSGPGFRQMIDKETSKGLKFEAHYQPLSRVGLLGLHTDSFLGDHGRKTIVSIQANDISGWFNPFGIGLRRWQLDDLHIKAGTVWLQKTEATPGEPKGPPPIPWWAIFWPYRVHLEDIKVDDATVLFKLQDKESGLYHIFLEITPNGRDFEYDGRGGVFKTPMTPALNLEHVHLLIRKPRLYCPIFVLGDDPDHPEEQMSVTGDAGLQDDKSMHVNAKIQSLSVSPWLPENLRAHVLGRMSGDVDYHSTGTGLETAQASGSIAIADGVLHQLPALEQYFKSTGSPDPGDLHLQTCQSDVRWEQGAIMAENLQIECPGVFRLTGHFNIAKDKTLTGELRLGLTDAYLTWLPSAKTTIFTIDDGDYHTTVIELSGTLQKPHQDLSARVLKQVEKSPLVAAKLFFNSL